jgi:hypothetical protein
MAPRAFRVSAISGVPALGRVQITDGAIDELELPAGSYPLPIPAGSPVAPTCPEGYVLLRVHPLSPTLPDYVACVPKSALEDTQERNKMLIVGGVVFVAIAGIAIYFMKRKGRR